MTASTLSGPSKYEFKVKGHLDERWSVWFEDLAISTGFDETGAPVTTFIGPIIDQADLYGVLRKIRNMNLMLISVNPVELIESKAKDESQVGTEGGADTD